MLSVIAIIVCFSVFTLRDQCLCRVTSEPTENSEASSSSSTSSSSEVISRSESSSSSSEAPTGVVIRSEAEQARIDAENVKFRQERGILFTAAGGMLPSLVAILTDKKVKLEDIEHVEDTRRINLKNADVSNIYKISEYETDILGQQGKSIAFEMKFAFKKVNYQSELYYRTRHFQITKHSKAKLFLVLGPRNIISVYGTVPLDILSRLQESKKSSRCLLTVTSVKVHSVSQAFKKIDIKFDVSIDVMHQHSINRLLGEGSQKIKAAIGGVLQNELEMAVRSQSIVC